MSESSTEIHDKAALILAEIKKAKSILLHCHPSPDPDSVGSALAMKFALEQLGKKATVIKGDSEIPQAFMHFPGAKDIVQKNFFEVDLKEFDLFIALDSARIEMVSRRGEVVFPSSLKVITIDHHQSNDMYGFINLVMTTYLANCQLLFDIFREWGIKLNPEIATNLFMGMYADTGGFKYAGVSASTFTIASELVRHIPDVSMLINTMLNSNTPGFMKFEGKALDSIEISNSGKFALASVSWPVLKGLSIRAEDVRVSEIASFMLTVSQWQVVACAFEMEPSDTEPNRVKFSFRSKDQDKYDVAKLAETMGGGGHKAAAGLILKMPFEEAKKTVVSKVKELYNL